MHIIISRLSITNQRTYQHQSLMVESFFSRPSLWTFYMLPNVQLQTSSAYSTRFVQSSISKWSTSKARHICYLHETFSIVFDHFQEPTIIRCKGGSKNYLYKNNNKLNKIIQIYFKATNQWHASGTILVSHKGWSSLILTMCVYTLWHISLTIRHKSRPPWLEDCNIYTITLSQPTSTAAHFIDTGPMLTLSLLEVPLIFQYFNPAHRSPPCDSNHDMVFGSDTKWYKLWVELTIKNQLTRKWYP
jgi:hypothetical protein